MDENTKRKEVLGLYEELKGVLSAIGEEKSWFDDGGFSTHTNLIIQRVLSVCPEIQDISSYLVKPEYLRDRGNIIQVTQTKAKLNSLIGRLKGLYGLDMPQKSEGTTFIQNQTQQQSQTITLVLELQEKILSEISNHAEGTKERTFLEKLKSSLPSISTSTDILANVLKIGSDVGISLEVIRKLLGL